MSKPELSPAENSFAVWLDFVKLLFLNTLGASCDHYPDII